MDERYVGIDLHRRRSVIHVMDGEGNKLSGCRIDNTPMNLLGALPPPAEGVEVVVEATYSWYWAVDLLQDNGYAVHLSHPSGKRVGTPAREERRARRP
jgi:hypothetical protein